MGLIKAGMGALGGTLADQWKEFFYCDSLDKDVLMVKGQKRTSRRSSNNGEDNIITNGSGIAVADGQCMLIVGLQYANGQITLNGQKMSLEDFVGMFAMPALNVPAVPAIPQQ